MRSSKTKPDDALKWYDKRNWHDINGGFWGWLVVVTSFKFNWTVGKYDQTTYVWFFSFEPLHVLKIDKKFSIHI